MTVGELQIPVQDLTRVLFHPSSRLPCIFLQTTPGCTNRIRLKCGMSHKDLNPYYDPMSKGKGLSTVGIFSNTTKIVARLYSCIFVLFYRWKTEIYMYYTEQSE